MLLLHRRGGEPRSVMIHDAFTFYRIPHRRMGYDWEQSAASSVVLGFHGLVRELFN
jgi:hypothetical protein